MQLKKKSWLYTLCPYLISNTIFQTSFLETQQSETTASWSARNKKVYKNETMVAHVHDTDTKWSKLEQMERQ